MKKISVLILMWLLVGGACTFDKITETPKNSIMGSWTLVAVESNEHWGGPLTWKDSTGKEIRFATDSVYYVKSDGQWVAAGRFSLSAPGQVTIGPLPYMKWASYYYNVNFTTAHELELIKPQFEGVVAERFRRTAF